MGTMRISLCMIVRDEVEALPRCLESAAPLVDEILVVDTGSLDGTPAIARAAGARVLDFEWSEDFAAARNHGLENARGDWALVLDADECVREPRAARALLEAFAAASPGQAGQLLVHNLGPEESRALLTRFFPLAPQWRYAGRIHERVLCEGREPPRARTGLEIEHTGYQPQIVAARGKLERNARLLERELAEQPEDPYLWYQLGRTRAVALEHVPALEAFERALASCREDVPFAAHLIESSAYSLRALGRSRQALGWLSGARLDPRRADSTFVLALLSMDCGELERAEQLFQNCLELEGTLPEGGESAPGASSFAAAYNLGVMREVQSDAAGARRWYERALQSNPRHAESLAGLERLARAGG
ncbi:MAG: glycosyltransferase [Planctomycetes bacterium]|nr:glycosyltransferase [Planctomycetota bacterium]